jgi:hypothetical protein
MNLIGFWKEQNLAFRLGLVLVRYLDTLHVIMKIT